MIGAVTSAIRMIWAALAIEVAGFAVDAVWHGFLYPEFEPESREQVLAHLVSVHTLFLIGVATLVLSTLWAVVAARRAGHGTALAGVALAGALAHAIGQTWDLLEHMRLSHGGPVAWGMIVVGPFVVLAALLAWNRRERSRAYPGRSGQHAPRPTE
jgi:hypothetical protein